MVWTAGGGDRTAHSAHCRRTVKLCRCGVPQDDSGFHELDPSGQCI